MLTLQYFGHLMWRADSLEKTLMLGKIESKRKRGWQRMRWLDSISDSMDINLSNSGIQWRTEEPGVLQSMRLQRVGHDLVTEQQHYLVKTDKHVDSGFWACVSSPFLHCHSRNCSADGERPRRLLWRRKWCFSFQSPRQYFPLVEGPGLNPGSQNGSPGPYMKEQNLGFCKTCPRTAFPSRKLLQSSWHWTAGEMLRSAQRREGKEAREGVSPT